MGKVQRRGCDVPPVEPLPSTQDTDISIQKRVGFLTAFHGVEEPWRNYFKSESWPNLDLPSCVPGIRALGSSGKVSDY